MVYFLAPKVFAFAFNIVKKFLDEYTLSKIMISKADRNKWLPGILEKVDKSQLPKYLGGELTDEDGNPKCVSKVKFCVLQFYGKKLLWLHGWFFHKRKLSF